MLLISPWASFCTTSPSYTINADLDTLPPNIIQRFRDAYIARTPLLPTAQSPPLKVASVNGRAYQSIQDPPIVGLDRGVGLVRPIGSFKPQAGRDDWWDGLGAVVTRILITSGDKECFRDDIVTLVNTMKTASQDESVTLEFIMDDSFHAVLVSDFAFGAPLSTFAAKLSGWLVDTLVDSEVQ
jgi:acetyl esterase/lipase